MYMRLCATKDNPLGEVRQFDLRDMEFLIINLDEQFYCLEARCTHAGAPLAEGSLKGNILTCPWHYSRFNIIDGSVVSGPAKKPLRVYKTAVKDGQLLVEIGEMKVEA